MPRHRKKNLEDLLRYNGHQLLMALILLSAAGAGLVWLINNP